MFDHLLVVDRGEETDGRRWRRSRVVGTYRVLRQEVADYYDGFYTQGEYDIQPLIQAKGSGYRFMELGRPACSSPTATSARSSFCGRAFGPCARARRRRHGRLPAWHRPRRARHGAELSHHHALAPEGWRVRAHEHLRVDMNMLPAEAVDVRAALKSLPPLIKGI